MSSMLKGPHTELALKVEAYVLTVWLLLATLAVSNTRYVWLLPVPWALLLLRWRASASGLVQIWRHWPTPLLASGVLAAWLALGASFGAPSLHSRLSMAAIALLWIPLAALIVGQRRAGRAIEWPLAAALLAVIFLNAIRVGHQLYGGSVRPSGYTHNVLLGACMLAIALVAASLLIEARLARSKRLAYAALGFGFALAIALISRARTPFVAGAVTLLAIVGGWRLRLSRATWIALLLVLAVWAALTSARWEGLVEQSLEYESATHKTSIGARVDMLRWAALHVRDIPAFGFGESGLAERMNQRYLEFGVDPAKIYRLIHMHNDILQLSFAHGLVAGVSYVVVLAAVLAGLYRRRRIGASGVGDPGSAAAAAAVLLLAIAGLFDCFLYWPKVWLAIQALLAVVMALQASQVPRAEGQALAGSEVGLTSSR
ncbi:MAG TPA: O-antigen ligase family protein [Burkholderiaceae bacterium]|nr:O-antigen ligase family protein [Burkholderiaceae bacterium]